MNRIKIGGLILLVLCSLIQSQLVPVPTVEIDIIPTIQISNEVNQSSPITKSTIPLDKIYETDKEGYDSMKGTFKNVLLWEYIDQDEELEKQLTNSLKQMNPNDNDLIFVKMQSNKNGLSLTHLQETKTLNVVLNVVSGQFFIGQFVNEVLQRITPHLIVVQNPNEFLLGNQSKLLLVMESNDERFQATSQMLQNLISVFREAGVLEVGYVNTSMYNVYDSGSLLLYTGSQNNLKRYENNLTYADQVQDFVQLETLPLIVPLGNEYLARVFGGPVATQFHLLIGDNDNGLLKELHKAALHNQLNDLYYERIIFTYSNYNDNEDLWKQFDFNAQTQTPQLVVTRTNFRKFQLEKYISNTIKQQDILDGPQITSDSIKEFIEEFRAHKITQFFRSEADPVTSDPVSSDPVTLVKVVGSTFLRDVIKGKTSTLVLYWDSKEPRASSEIERVLTLLNEEIPQSKKNLIKICTFDLALNEHPSIVIDRAPALYLYVSGDKRRPKDYNLLIELDQLKAWLSYWIADLKLVEFDEEGFRVKEQLILKQASDNKIDL